MKDIQVLTANKYNYLHSTSTNLSITSRGINKLIQEVTLYLKRTPGRDIFSPDIGVGLRRSLPMTHSEKTKEQVLTTVASSINKMESDIIESQMGSNLDKTEMLDEVVLEEITFDEADMTWYVTLRVYNKAGNSNLTIIVI